VYRIEAVTDQAAVATGDVNRPNGLCRSPDQSNYVSTQSAVGG
jgi:hypothetical protein